MDFGYDPLLKRLIEEDVLVFSSLEELLVEGKGLIDIITLPTSIHTEGYVILDGPMHNALAHFLNNMFYLASDKPDQSGKLSTVRAELYRGNPHIQADDTSCFIGETVDRVKIHFYVTHCSQKRMDPYMEIVGTKGKAIWNFDETTDNSRSLVLAINGSYLSSEVIWPIPAEYVAEHDTESRFLVKDIDQLLDQAFNERKQLSDLNLPWACSSKTVNVANLTEFNPFQEICTEEAR